jgi:hypothetical protein
MFLTMSAESLPPKKPRNKREDVFPCDPLLGITDVIYGLRKIPLRLRSPRRKRTRYAGICKKNTEGNIFRWGSNPPVRDWL